VNKNINYKDINMSTEWTPNDYSNIATVGAAALCSVLLVVFKSRCSNISLCCGALSCERNVPDADNSDEEQPVVNNPAQPPPPQQD
jgi:hypothetical protein